MRSSSTPLRVVAQLTLTLFLSNIIAPSLHYAYANDTNYFVDAVNGSDANDGLSAGTAWQTLAAVNAANLWPNDVVSFQCGDTFTGTLQAFTGGNPGLPVIFTRYGTGCTGSNNPLIENVEASGSYLSFRNLNIEPITGTGFQVATGNTDIVIEGVTLSGATACVEAPATQSLTISGSTFQGCSTAVSAPGADGSIVNSRFTAIWGDAVSIPGGGLFDIRSNTFKNIDQSAVVFGLNQAVQQNVILNACQVGGASCAALKNANITQGLPHSASIVNNEIRNVGTGVVGGNAAIRIEGAVGISVSGNFITNSETALSLVNAAQTTISQNSLFYPRARTVSVVQTVDLASSGNVLSQNTISQRNPDYSYIEMRDQVEGGAHAPQLTASNNYFYPLYKPNTSYIRDVKYGQDTVEYTKKQIDLFDATNTKFEFFGYRPYTSTGVDGANLLNNSDLTVNTIGWVENALSGAAPSVVHNPSGTYNGGSLELTPAGGAADRITLTNSAILTITTGEVYHITGYIRSMSGNLNLKAYLHQSGNISTLYSDRVAETYASQSGRVFDMYITAQTDAVDAEFTLETDNNTVGYEIDEVTLTQVTGLTKNTTANEVIMLVNTGAAAQNMSCPFSPAVCSNYYDKTNTSMGGSRTISVPAHSAELIMRGDAGYINILNVPSCQYTNSPLTSSPNNVPYTIDWSATGSLSTVFDYATQASGSVSEIVSWTGSRTFIPPSGATTPLTLTAENDIGICMVSLNVTTNNTPPNLIDGTTTGTEDTVINGSLSGSDAQGDDFAYFSRTPNPAYGVVNIDALSGSAGLFDYTPSANFCGTDTFGFRANDGFIYSTDHVQTVNVTCVNDAPVAVNDAATIINGSGSFDPVTNDTDVDNAYELQVHTVSVYSQPAHGSLTLSGNTFTYIPSPLSYTGADSFTYRITDQSGAVSNSGTVNLTVTLINYSPSLADVGFSLTEDTPYTDVLVGTDPESDPLTYSASLLPAHGTLSLMASGTFTYTPDLNYNGADSFQVQPFDGTTYGTAATISLTITPTLDDPLIVNDTFSVPQDSTTFLPVGNNDINYDGGGFILTGETQPTHGTVVISGTWYVYTSASGYVGPDSFTYSAFSTEGGTGNTATVTLNVTVVNAPPSTSDLTITVNEDTPYLGVVTGTDPNGDTLTFAIDGSTSNGVLNLLASGSYTYTPDPNFFGSDSFAYHATDASLSSTSSTVTITVNPVNDAPTATGSSYTMTMNTPAANGNTATGILVASDVDSVSLTFTAATLPTHGVLLLSSTGVFQYTPAINYSGTDTFIYQVSDGALTATASVLITISSTNQSPTAQSGTLITNEDTIGTLTLVASDPDGNPISYFIDTNPAHGTASISASGILTYTPALNYAGADSVTYHVNDGTSNSASAVITLTVNPVNDAPTATPGTLTATPNSLTASGNVAHGTLAGTDIEGQTLSFTIALLPTNGTVLLGTNGAYDYTPNLGFTGTDAFQFSAVDASGATSSPAQVVISVAYPVVIVQNPSIAGPGGGGGGGAGASYYVPTLQPKIDEKTGNASYAQAKLLFTTLPGQELAGQLFLLNPFLSGKIELEKKDEDESSDDTVESRDESLTTEDISIESEMLSDALQTPQDLRRLARQIDLQVQDSAPDLQIAQYETALENVYSLDAGDDERLLATQLYIIRMYEKRVNDILEESMSPLPSAPEMTEESIDSLLADLGTTDTVTSPESFSLDAAPEVTPVATDTATDPDMTALLKELGL